jgi:hypothetical protein
LFPVTDLVPTTVPPVLQSVGAEACGPNTRNVMVPVGLAPLDNVELILPPGIGVPTVAVAGAVAVAVGFALTTTVCGPLSEITDTVLELRFAVATKPPPRLKAAKCGLELAPVEIGEPDAWVSTPVTGSARNSDSVLVA